MFKLHIYSARSLNSIPNFEHATRRARRAVVAFEKLGAPAFGLIGRDDCTIGRGVTTKSPVRGSM